MKRTIISICALALIIAIANPVQAESNKEKMTQDLASILLKLEFYPSFKERRFLKNVSMDERATDSQRTIASAIINFQHRPLHSDLAKLEKVINDENATASEQELAYIIHRLKYKVTQADKKILERILQ